MIFVANFTSFPVV